MNRVLRAGIYLQGLMLLTIVSFIAGLLFMNKYVPPRLLIETRYMPPIDDSLPELGIGMGGILYVSDEYHTVLCRDEFACLHEVGHLVYLEHVNPEQWEDDFLNYLENGHGGTVCELSPTFSHFPGICDNPLATRPDNGEEWGGVGEAYAQTYAEFHKFGEGWREKPPEELMKYFSFDRRNTDD